jgi:hypothetical protein
VDVFFLDNCNIAIDNARHMVYANKAKILNLIEIHLVALLFVLPIVLYDISHPHTDLTVEQFPQIRLRILVAIYQCNMYLQLLSHMTLG